MLLREELDQELLRYNFISLSALHKLVHAASIQSCLFESGVTVQPNVLEEITSRSPKLFALLTLQGREYSIEDYHLTGFHDDNFPLLKEEDVPHVGSRDERLSIYRAQWKIPIVLEKSRHLDLPPEFVPPFLEERTVGHGAFGFVSRVRVADGHLPGYSSVRIKMPRLLRFLTLLAIAEHTYCVEAHKETRPG